MTNCETELKPIVFSTVEVENNYDAEIVVTLDKATGTNQLAKTINNQIETSIITSISPDDGHDNLNDVLESFNAEYLKFKSEFPDESDPKWEMFIETEKTYQSNEIISIALSIYEFKGGAHGNDQINFLNLNATTGEVIENNQLVNDSLKLKEIAKTYFIEELKASSNDINLEDYFYGKAFQLPENIGLGEEGLIMLYNTYEIASYAQGYTEFVIPFEALDSILLFN